MPLTKQEFFKECLYNELRSAMLNSAVPFSALDMHEFADTVALQVISFCTQQGREF